MNEHLGYEVFKIIICINTEVNWNRELGFTVGFAALNFLMQCIIYLTESRITCWKRHPLNLKFAWHVVSRLLNTVWSCCLEIICSKLKGSCMTHRHSSCCLRYTPSYRAHSSVLSEFTTEASSTAWRMYLLFVGMQYCLILSIFVMEL